MIGRKRWFSKPGKTILGPGLLAACLFASGTVGMMAEPTNGTFSDVDAYWGKPYVLGLTGRGAIAGFPDGTFRPDAYVTRAQFAAILVHALNLTIRPDAPMPFADVSSKDWAAPAIKTVASADYIRGYPGGTFHPDARITRMEALLILAKTLPEPKGDEERRFERYQDFNSVPKWAIEAVAKAAASHIIVDFPDSAVIRPNDDATRGEIAALVYQDMRQMGNDLQPINIGMLGGAERPDRDRDRDRDRHEHREVRVATPPPAPPPARLGISSVTLQPHQVLKAGMDLIVTVHGTPGKIGTFNIAGVTQDQALREMQPGVYQGSYVTKGSDARLNCQVSATLRSGDQVANGVAAEVANFGAVAPQITQLIPSPNAIIGNRRTSVGANYRDVGGAMNLRTVQLTINGHDVTPMCEISASAIRYNHPIPFRSNRLNMHLVVTDQAGNSAQSSWTVGFNSPPPGSHGRYRGPYYHPPNPPSTKQVLERDLINVINAL